MKAYLTILHAFFNIHGDKIAFPFILHIWALFADLEKKIYSIGIQELNAKSMTTKLEGHLPLKKKPFVLFS